MMWTDGRYYLSADKELYEGWKMMKMEKSKMYYDWVTNNMKDGDKIGLDTNQISCGPYKNRTAIFKKKGIEMVPSSNLIDEVWGEEKPPMSSEKVFILDEKFTGQSTLSKYTDIMAKVPKDSDMLFVASLDDIAWTLNFRGNDIEYNPLFFSYMVLHRDGENVKVDLFIMKDKVSAPEVQEYLS
jgi:Xaa-Pro aminopeptidase